MTMTWRAASGCCASVMEVPHYDRDLYVTERQWAVARDGVKVPLVDRLSQRSEARW